MSELNGLNWLNGIALQTIVEPVNHRPDNEVDVIEPLDVEDDHSDNTDDIHEVYIMNPKHEDRASSFFAQPGVLAGKFAFFSIFFLQLVLLMFFLDLRLIWNILQFLFE